MALASRNLRSTNICSARTSKPSVALRRPVVALRAATFAAEVTDETFDTEVLESSVPVLVDFWAPWCGPCKMIAPMVDEIAQEYGSRAKAVKINTDASPQTASRYGVRSIPTVMIFKNGERQETIIGAVPKSSLTQALDKFL